MWCILFISCCYAFMEDFLNDAFSGGGGFQFHMDGGEELVKKVKWPKHVSKTITKKFNWIKGTEWNWNNWSAVKFVKDGTFDAPTQDCQMGRCKWAANKGKVFVLWGDAGVHELTLELRGSQKMPDSQDLDQLNGLKMAGHRLSDGETCFATFQRVYDHEAAELDKDLYSILGVSDASDDATIKSAYRKLSLKYHPDKNPDESSRKKFGDVRDAYEILNDPRKKIMYDIGGMETVKEMEKGNMPEGQDTEVTLKVTLTELYTGAEKGKTLRRRVVCRGCGGNPNMDRCRDCGQCPNEKRLVQRQMGHMIIQQQEEVASKEKCKQEATQMEPHIERGMKDGDVITFPNMGEQRPGVIPGDVIFKLKQQKDTRFERTGYDLHYKLDISLKEALLGFKRTIKHLDGHTVEFSTDDVTFHGQVYKIDGEGMPHRDDPSTFGKLFLKSTVEFPSKFTADQKKAIEGFFAGAHQEL
eukprot:GEMP01006022.1.p1 GENE.GEMP01006022.1~~GEMP01006022.1.p1  ORF type:complete len:470 (+),score=90.43 GEMP01006022.1:456-1865(+)